MAKPKHTKASLQHILDVLKQNDGKNIGFDVVIDAFSDHDLEPIDPSSKADQVLISDLKSDLRSCINQVVATGGIDKNTRVNEVGNKMEQPVIDAINNSTSTLNAEKPKTQSGIIKTTGYPDVLVYDAEERPTYLEIKTYSPGKEDTTLRSFYLSPSDDFKVTQNARHLLAAFEMKKPDGDDGHIPINFKLVDLSGLICSVKFEIQSNNRRLYAEGIIL